MHFDITQWGYFGSEVAQKRISMVVNLHAVSRIHSQPQAYWPEAYIPVGFLYFGLSIQPKANVTTRTADVSDVLVSGRINGAYVRYVVWISGD